jgi:hypothetical protein
MENREMISADGKQRFHAGMFPLIVTMPTFLHLFPEKDAIASENDGYYTVPLAVSGLLRSVCF